MEFIKIYCDFCFAAFLSRLSLSALIFHCAFLDVSAQSIYVGPPSNYSWSDLDIGKSSVILPGFSPIKMDGMTVNLYSRKYKWDKSYFPSEISSRGYWLVKSFQLVARVNGGEVVLKPKKVEVISSAPDSVTIAAEGNLGSELAVKTTTTVEYDGFATVSVSIKPTSTVKIDGLSVVLKIKDANSMSLLGYKAENIRPQKLRNDILKIPYLGAFYNVLDFADGERSFWWISDNAEGWVWNGPAVTEVTKGSEWINLRQWLIGAKYEIKKPMNFSFSYLVTPVKELGNEWRSRRVVSAHPSAFEAALGGKYKIWWTSAFAHDAFPYINYPSEAVRNISVKDRYVYPGVLRNKNQIVLTRNTLGIEWIPYFSAHCISVLDPVLNENRGDWQVEPLASYRDGLDPYGTKFEKPLLTHRSDGYSNYLLSRLSDAIKELKMAGIYFDHGNVIDSINPRNGMWVDSNGVHRASLDILATRLFYKRLQNIFFENKLPGYVFVHDSAREIFPAYTFITATVDGEQYRSEPDGPVILKNGQYLDFLSLDEIRVRFSSFQYGIGTIWLAEEWTGHLKPGMSNAQEMEWQSSEQNRNAYRKLVGLTLLNDVLDWDPYAHVKERESIIRLLDDFGIGNSEFNGYWKETSILNPRPKNIVASYYLQPSKKRALAVVVNAGNTPYDGILQFNGRVFGEDTRRDSIEVFPLVYGVNSGGVLVHIRPGDFALFEVREKLP